MLDTILSEVVHYAAEPRSWLVVLVLLVAGTVKGGIGFGMPLVAVSLLANVIELRLVAALMLFPIIAGNLWVAMEGGEFWPILRRFWTVVLAIGVGMFTGAQLLVLGGKNVVLMLLGVFVSLFAVAEQFKAQLQVKIPSHLARPWGVVAGLLGGVSGGMSSVFGPPLVMYLTALRQSKDSFVRSNSVISFFASLFMALAFTSARVMTLRTSILSALCVAPVFAGVFLGRQLRMNVNQRVFERVVAIGLLFLGLNLIRRALLIG